MEELQLTQPLHLVHQSVNAILVQETGRHFPPQRKEDRRISANLGYRAGATRIQRAFRALKQQSKQLKVAFHQDQLRQAEAAAAQGIIENCFRL